LLLFYYKGIKLPGEPGGKELEAKINMFADDTQLFNKDERSVELYRMLFVDLRKLLCLLHFLRLRIV
jgi:hypothetical protein